MKQLSRGQNFLSLFVAGALFPLALAPFSLWPIASVSIAVLFWQLQHQSITQALIKASVYGFGLFFAGASWVYVSIHEHGFIPAPLALLATALFCLFLALLFAAPCALSALIPQTPSAWIIGLPAIWVLSEWIRTWIFTGFPWLFAGYAHTQTWLNGWAPVGGVLWLSFICALSAAVLAQLGQGKIARRATSRAALALLLLTACGYALQYKTWTVPSGQRLDVVLVQPNIEQHKKWASDSLPNILAQLKEQSKAHWGSDLVVWPEAAVPALSHRVKGFLGTMHQRAEASETTLLTGIPTYDRAQKKYHNSMIALGNVESERQYNKTRLVPFGEYVPMESVLRGLITFFNLPMSTFSLGADNQAPFTVQGENISTAICYEVVYPDLVARKSRDSSVLLTVSNDAWFGQSLGPQQHMQMAQMRALENAKPMIRGTNNGISALVDHQGRIYQSIEQYTQGELVGTIEPRNGRTLFSLLGSWPTVILALLSFFGLLMTKRTTKEAIHEH
jgi:apolipoprotein N-acyltransferase